MASQPVPVHLDLLRNQIQNVLFQIIAGDPSTPDEGQVWYDSAIDAMVVQATSGRKVGGATLDQVSAPVADVAFANRKATGLADPTNPQDAATKAYADALIVGLDLREAARVAAKTNISLAAPGATIDGVSLSSGDRVLLTAQTAPAENGVWVWTGAAAALTRATDFDTSSDMDRGVLIPVQEGTANKGLYMHTTNVAITVGTTALVFTDLTPRSSGGTAKFSGTGPGAAGTTWAITHGLGSADVVVSVRYVSSNIEVICETVHTDANTVTLNFNQSQAQNSLRAVVVG